MNKIVLFVAVFLIVLAVILGAVWFFGGQKASTSDNQDETSQANSQELTKTNGDTNPGNVQVDVTLVTEDNATDIGASDYDLSKDQLFYVEMNTHSVDLAGYDMADISFLKTDGKEVAVSKWESAMEANAHHSSGFLVFEKEEAKVLTLIIKGIPNIDERKLEWKL